MLLILLCFSYTSYSQTAEDYFYSNNHPKAKGLKFQLKKPLGFEQNEADRPNVVQKWEKYNSENDNYLTFMILVRKDESLNNFTKEEWRKYLKNDGGVEDITSEISGSENSKFFSLDNYPGYINDSSITLDRLDSNITIYMTEISVFLESHRFTIQLASPKKDLKNNNKKLFYMLANSVVFPHQYN